MITGIEISKFGNRCPPAFSIQGGWKVVFPKLSFFIVQFFDEFRQIL
jgi:hypothetical protein